MPVKLRAHARRESTVRAIAASLVVGLILGLVLLNFPAGEKRSTTDFSSFYCAAQIIRQGMGRELYNLGVQAGLQSRVAAVHAFFNHPPYEALWFLPFTYFSYRTAYILWTLTSMGLLALSTFWIQSCTGVLGAISAYARIRPDFGLLFVLFLTFAPATTCLLLGENSMVTLLIYTLVFVLMKRGSDFEAGCILALGLYKFQLILPFVLILILRKKWRLVKGFSCATALLVLLSVAISGFGVLVAYPRLLFFDPTYQKIAGFAPDFMPNLRGFLFLVTRSRVTAPAFSLTLAALSAVCLGWTAKSWREDQMELSFSAALLATLLASYHLYNYDLTLLLLPIAILAGELAKREQLMRAHTLNAALIVLLIPPLHRELLLHSIYPLMTVPIGMLFLTSLRLVKTSSSSVEGIEIPTLHRNA